MNRKSRPDPERLAGASTIELGVLLFDPSLPYSFAADDCIGDEEWQAAARLKAALSELPQYRCTYFEDHRSLIDALRDVDIDLVLNFCDVGYCNDWNKVLHIPALLDILEVPYTGADATAMVKASDKASARSLAQGCSVPVPDEVHIDLDADQLVLPRSYPALIKPSVGGGSFGISQRSVVNDDHEALEHLRALADSAGAASVLAQELLTGDEYTVGVIGNPEDELEVLPVMMVDYSALDPGMARVFTYDAKFDAESPYYQKIGHRRAELDDDERSEIATHCRRLFRRLGLRDYARFDFRRDDDGRIVFLDANTNPTWYWDSRFSMMASWAGYDYPRLLHTIVETARKRSHRSRS